MTALAIAAALLLLLVFQACLWARIIDLEARVDSVASEQEVVHKLQLEFNHAIEAAVKNLEEADDVDHGGVCSEEDRGRILSRFGRAMMDRFETEYGLKPKDAKP